MKNITNEEINNCDVNGYAFKLSKLDNTIFLPPIFCLPDFIFSKERILLSKSVTLHLPQIAIILVLNNIVIIS